MQMISHGIAVPWEIQNNSGFFPRKLAQQGSQHYNFVHVILPMVGWCCNISRKLHNSSYLAPETTLLEDNLALSCEIKF